LTPASVIILVIPGLKNRPLTNYESRHLKQKAEQIQRMRDGSLVSAIGACVAHVSAN
jgi:hypothetical protein